MNPSTALAVPEKIDSLVATIREDKFRAELEKVLPEGISPDRFARVVHTALLDDAARQSDASKMLVNCDQASLYQAVIRCAQDGLLPDGREAALVKRGAKASYMPMVGGFRKIAGDHGWTIRGYAIHANDEFDYTVEPPSITFRPARAGMPRGDVVAAYAIATHRDGRREQLVVDGEELEKRRKSATTQTVWSQWTPQMAEKTAVRDLFSELPMDASEDPRVTRLLEAVAAAGGADLLYGTRVESAFGELPSPDVLHRVDESPSLVTGEEPAPPDAGVADDPVAGPVEPVSGSGAGPSAEDFGDYSVGLELAQAAAGFVVGLTNTDSWAHGKTLAEINADDRAEVFFRFVLSRPSAGPLRSAVVDYCRVQRPDLYEELVK